MKVRSVLVVVFFLCLSGLLLQAQLSEEQQTVYALNATRIFCQVFMVTKSLSGSCEGLSMMQCTSCGNTKQSIGHVLGTLGATGYIALKNEQPVSQEIEVLVIEAQALQVNSSFSIVQSFCVKAANLLAHPCLNCQQTLWSAYVDPLSPAPVAAVAD